MSGQQAHEQIVTQFLLWKETVLRTLPKAKLAHSAISAWSPWDYLLGLDGTTRFAVILALIVCSYVLFSSVWRFSRMIYSVSVFIMQLALVFVVVLFAMQYRELFTQLVTKIAQKLEL
jgi:hypothetical protein